MKPKALFPVLCFVLVLTFISGCETEDLIIPPDEEYFYDRNAIKSGDDGSIIYYANELFVREAGKPVLVTRKIGGPELANFADCLKLHIKSGANGSDFVSSAILKIDGIVLLNSSDFTNSDQELTIDLCNLTESSILELVIYGTPGSVLEIWIDGSLRYDLKEGLVAYYEFNGNTIDLSGNECNIINQGISFSDSYGIFRGQAYGYILDNDALNLESATGVTFVARVKRDGNTGGFIMQRMGFGYCEDDEFDLGLTDDGRVYSDFNGPSCTYKGILSINSIAPDTWTTIATNWDQATQTLNVYIDGVLDNTTDTPVTSIQNTATPIRIGMPPFDYLKSFTGSLDYLRIYSRTLSPGELQLLANY